MRYLICGVTPVSSGHRPKLDYISAVLAVKSGLELAGNEVDIRPAILGENFSQYDRVVVFIASMRGFVSVHTLSALWAVHAAADKLTLAFDDWQTRESLIGVRMLQAEREKILAKNPFGYRQIERVAEYKDSIWLALDRLAAPTWDFNVLVPAYKGGDLSLLQIPTGSKLFTFNPSVLFKGKYGWVEESAFDSKDVAWILAALHDHRSWLKKQRLTWPVKQYGHRKQGQERLKEAEIYAQCAASLGVLSPAYRTCGSGWWRQRYSMAADALCVIAGGESEAAMIDYQAYAITPAAVENYDAPVLAQMALWQREAYYKAAGTVEEMQADILASFK